MEMGHVGYLGTAIFQTKKTPAAEQGYHLGFHKEPIRSQGVARTQGIRFSEGTRLGHKEPARPQGTDKVTRHQGFTPTLITS